jgi:Flavoprotein
LRRTARPRRRHLDNHGPDHRLGHLPDHHTDGPPIHRRPCLERLTGHPVRSDYKQPDEPDVLPPPQAIIVAPATCNTINKWAAGISDTLALGLIVEAIGMKLPQIAMPYTNWAGAVMLEKARTAAIGRELRGMAARMGIPH